MKPNSNNSHFAFQLSFLKAGLIIFSVFLFALVVKGSFGYFVFLFLDGWLIWSFTEYGIHRFFMHELMLPGEKENIFNHQEHHKNPHDLVVKPLHRILLLILALTVFVIAMKLNNLFTVFSGFLTGFLLYNLLHFLLHQPYCKYLFPSIQRKHILHHSRFPNKGYSLSTSLWDWLFDTLTPKDAEITEKMLENFFGHSNYPKSLTLKTSKDQLRKYSH